MKLGFHSSVAEDSGRLGCDFMSIVEWSLLFLRSIVPLFAMAEHCSASAWASLLNYGEKSVCRRYLVMNVDH